MYESSTPDTTTLRCAAPEDTLALGGELAAQLSGGECIALHAPLGAGKTVLVKGIARGLGIEDVVTSPTYTIVSEYHGRLHLVHVDLYRINSEEEYEQLAIEDLLGPESVLVLEWPTRAGSALPETTLHVSISLLPNGMRIFTVPQRLAPSRRQNLHA